MLHYFPSILRNNDRLSNSWSPLFRGLETFLDDQSERSASFTPACNISEYEKHYLLSFDMPGLKKEDLNIELDGRQLTVTGERKFEKNESKIHFSEFRYGKFSRSVTLPEEIKGEEISANYENGVLYVAIPKPEKTGKTKVSIREGDDSFFNKLGEPKEKKLADVS